jgi:hypothetical protein
MWSGQRARRTLGATATFPFLHPLEGVRATPQKVRMEDGEQKTLMLATEEKATF